MTNVAPCVESPVEPLAVEGAGPMQFSPTSSPTNPVSPRTARMISAAQPRRSLELPARQIQFQQQQQLQQHEQQQLHEQRTPSSSPRASETEPGAAAGGASRPRAHSFPNKPPQDGRPRRNSAADPRVLASGSVNDDDEDEEENEVLFASSGRRCKVVESSPQGRFVRFNERLGEGSFKRVYRAWDSTKGVEVAWNTVRFESSASNSGGARRVIQEMQILQNLNHDSIIKFFGSWLDHKKMTVVFITELISSGTLQEFIQDRPVCLNVLKRWCRDILGALVYLHGHQPPIIHRDLKCENVFINGCTGDLRIGDLGLASWRRDSLRKQSILGTPEYMAPELYDEHYDEKVDIYAFGMCVLEMVVKEPPYSECSTAAQIFRKVTRGDLPAAFARVTSDPIVDFIGKCIRKPAPGASRPSAQDLLADDFLREQEVDNGVDCATFVADEDDVEAARASAHPATLQRSGSETAAASVGSESLPVSETASCGSARLDPDAVVVLEIDEESVPQHSPRAGHDASASPPQPQPAPLQPQAQAQFQTQPPAAPGAGNSDPLASSMDAGVPAADPLTRLPSSLPIAMPHASIATAANIPRRASSPSPHLLNHLASTSPAASALNAHADGRASPLSHSSGSTYRSLEASSGSEPYLTGVQDHALAGPAPALAQPSQRLSSLSTPAAPTVSTQFPLEAASTGVPSPHQGAFGGAPTLSAPVHVDNAVRSSSTGELPLPSESGYPIKRRARRESDWICSAHPSETDPNSIDVHLAICRNGEKVGIRFPFDLTESPSETVREMVAEGCLPASLPASELRVLTAQLEHFRNKFSQIGAADRSSTFRDRSSSSTSIASGSSSGTSAQDQEEARREEARRLARERAAAEKESERRRTQAEVEDLERKLREPFFMETNGLRSNSNAPQSVISGASSLSSCNSAGHASPPSMLPPLSRSIR